MSEKDKKRLESKGWKFKAEEPKKEAPEEAEEPEKEPEDPEAGPEKDPE